MDDETRAQRLAQWLSSPPGTDPPEDLDPEVLAAVYALQPDRAPAPRVSLDDILGAVESGPFALPTTDNVVEFPRSGFLGWGGTDGAARGEGAVRPGPAGGPLREDPPDDTRAAEDARGPDVRSVGKRRGPSRFWASPALGVAMAAAAAALLALPMAAKLAKPDIAAQEAAREAVAPPPSASVIPEMQSAPPPAPGAPAPIEPAPIEAAPSEAAPIEPAPSEAAPAELGTGEPSVTVQPRPADAAGGFAGEELAEEAAASHRAEEAPAATPAKTGATREQLDGFDGTAPRAGGVGAPGYDSTGGYGAGTTSGYGARDQEAASADPRGPDGLPEMEKKARGAPASATRSPAPLAQTPPASSPAEPPVTPAPAASSTPTSSMSTPGSASSAAPAPSAPYAGAPYAGAPAAGAPAAGAAPTGKARATKETAARSEPPTLGPAPAAQAQRPTTRTAAPAAPAAPPPADAAVADEAASIPEADYARKLDADDAEERAATPTSQQVESVSARRRAEPPKAKSARADASNVSTPSATPLDYDPRWYRAVPEVAARFDALLAEEAAGRWDAAAAGWASLATHARTDVAQDAAFRAAKAHRAAGRLSDALSAVDAGLRRGGANTPFRANLYALRAELLSALGRAAEADAARRQAVELNTSR